MLTVVAPLWIHCFLLLCIFILLLMDFLLPLYLYHYWYRCFQSTRLFLHTVESEQQWLIRIHGFQLIRPTSSLFERELFQLRQTLFEELRQHFLTARRISRQYSTTDALHLISSIDLDEFGPLLCQNLQELQSYTNQFDQTSIKSMLKLFQLQLNESIQLIHLKRPTTWSLFVRYRRSLLTSIERIHRMKQNCSIMVHSIDERPESSKAVKKLIPWYFLLRSTCEQLFAMNESNTIDADQLKRMVQDLKTVVYSLEALQNKPLALGNERTADQTLGDDTQASSSSHISSFHRFDDQIAESIDEILIGETGHDTDENLDGHRSEFDHDEQRFLREQARCLMKELQTAIAGKKQEWTDREQRLFGDQPIQEDLVPEKPPIEDEEPFERIAPMQNSLSMMDELKHTFVLNRKKLNVDEDVFGEEDDNDDD